MTVSSTDVQLVLYRQGVVRTDGATITIFFTAMRQLDEAVEPALAALLGITEGDEPRQQWVVKGSELEFRGVTWRVERIQGSAQGGPLVVLAPLPAS